MGQEVKWSGNGTSWTTWYMDENESLDNYGQIIDHPELLNANISTGGGGPPGGGGGGPSDWFHVNGVDYNPELDQIVFSSRFLSEIFVIDPQHHH